MRTPIPWVLRIIRWTPVAEKGLTALNDARSGGPLAWVLGAAAIMGAVTETITSRWRPDILLTHYGFVRYGGELASFLCDCLRESDFKYRSMRTQDESSTIDMWTLPGASEPQVAVLHADRRGHSDGTLYIKGGVNLADVFRPALWAKGTRLMLSSQLREWQSHYSLIPMDAVGKYFGDFDDMPISEIADRLRPSGERTRSLLLVGPSGSGKTTTGCLLAKELAGDDARILKIAGTVLRQCSFEVVIEFALTLQPTVLLLDDLPLDSKVGIEQLLTLLEALRGKTSLVVATFMDDETTDDDYGKPGIDYWPGMRPGRIDMILRARRPDLSRRKLILRDYFELLGVKVPEEQLHAIAEACEGLTGAYLREVSERLQERGLLGWEREVASIRRAAPLKHLAKDAPDEPSSEEEGEDPKRSWLGRVRNRLQPKNARPGGLQRFSVRPR